MWKNEHLNLRAGSGKGQRMNREVGELTTGKGEGVRIIWEKNKVNRHHRGVGRITSRFSVIILNKRETHI